MTDEKSNSGKSFLIWMGVLLGLIVIAILIGIFKQNSVDDLIQTDYYDYNGFTFTKTGSVWQTTINKYTIVNETNTKLQEIPFYANYGPLEVENISLDANISNIIQGTDTLVLTFDPKFRSSMSQAGIEIGKVLVSFYNWPATKVKVAVNVVNDTSGFPYADCNNATNGTKVISFNFGNETQIIQSEDCIDVIGNQSRDIVKAADLIMYKLLGIIK